MNWQMCRDKPGTWLTMQGTAVAFEPKQGNYGPYGLGSVRDLSAEIQKVLFGSNDKSPLPDASCVNQPAQWGALYDANKQQYKVLFNNFITDQPAGVRPFQAPPQAPQNAPQSTNGKQVVDTQLLIVRQSSLNRAVEVALAYNPQDLDWDKVFIASERCKHYIYNGLPKTAPQATRDYSNVPKFDEGNEGNEGNQGSNNPPTGSGIPF